VIFNSAGNLDLNNRNQTIGSLSGNGYVNLGSGTLTIGDDTNTAHSGGISGTGNLVKQGSGRLEFTTGGANSYNYTGTTTINEGTLACSTFVGPAKVTLADVPGATLEINSAMEVSSLNGGGVHGGNVYVSGALYVNNETDTTYAGVISGSAPGITKQGAGTLTLTGVNTFSGPMYINEGTVRLSGGDNRWSSRSTIQLSNGTLDISGHQTIGTLCGPMSGSGNISLNSGTLTVTQTSEAEYGYGGVISGVGGSFVKEGPGRLWLTGKSTYTGATIINSGILAVWPLMGQQTDGLPAATAVTLANAPGALLDLTACQQTIASLSGGGASGGNIDITGGRLIVGNGDSTTYAGIISGASGSLAAR
jgi:fibronectin-binding autotransporter adhesin